jgi:hypothetical protein
MAQALDGFWAASEAWTARASLSLSPAANMNDRQVIETVDAMPLTRVRTTQTMGDKLRLEIETGLDRIPFQHALDAAIRGVATHAGSPVFERCGA